MHYEEVEPAARLKPFVKCLWTLTGEAIRKERIVPDGSFELVFHFGDVFRSGGTPQPEALLVGEIARPTVVETSGRADVLGVRFRPGAISAFLRFAAAGAANSIVRAEEVLSGISAPVFDTGSATRIDVLTAMLTARLRDETPPRDVTAAVRVMKHHPQLRIRKVAETVGVTERSMERQFERHVGVPPKMFSRLMRFHSHLRSPERDAGYVDASHLHRDFLQFAGLTPGGWARERHALSDEFSAAG